MHRMELVVRERRTEGEQVTSLGWLDLQSAEAEPDTQACRDALRRVLEHLQAHPLAAGRGTPWLDLRPAG
ncbi:hypothetical protein H1235_16645 [Pseudoxanthomonas sp. NC8]|nr:hypothetical protein H1235_16645 [Pseudoxanthomonas sp. NC8]